MTKSVHGSNTAVCGSVFLALMLGGPATAQTVGPPIGEDRTISLKTTTNGRFTNIETSAGRNWRSIANQAGAFLQSDTPTADKIALLEAEHAEREPIFLFLLFQLHMLEGDLEKAAYWGRLARARVAYDVGRCADERGNPWRSSLVELQQYIDDDLKSAIAERLNASLDALGEADLRARRRLLDEPKMIVATAYSPWWACSNMASISFAAVEGEKTVITESEWLLPATEWPAVEAEVTALVRAPLDRDVTAD